MDFVIALLRKFEPDSDSFLPDPVQDTGEEETQRDEARKAKATNLEIRRNRFEEWINASCFGGEQHDGDEVSEHRRSEVTPTEIDDTTTEETVKCLFLAGSRRDAAVATDLEVNKKIQILPVRQNRGVFPATHSTPPAKMTKVTGSTRTTEMKGHVAEVSRRCKKRKGREARPKKPHKQPPPKPPESLDSGVGPAALIPPTTAPASETQVTQMTVAKVLEQHEEEILQQGGAKLELQQISQHFYLSQHLRPPFDLMGRAQQVCNYFTTQELLSYSLLLSQNRGLFCGHIDCGPLVKKGTGPFKNIISTMNLEDTPVKEQLQPSFSAGIGSTNLCRDSATVGWETFHECSYNEDKEESDLLNGGQIQRKLSDSEDNIEKIGDFLSFEKSIVQGGDKRLSCGYSSFREETDIDGTPRVWDKRHKFLLPKTSSDDGIVIRYWLVDALSLLLEPSHGDTKMVVDKPWVAKWPPPEPPDCDVEGYYCIQRVLWLADKDNSTVVQNWEKTHWVNISDARTSYAYNSELLAYKFTTDSKMGRCSGFSGLGGGGFDLATQLLSSYFCKVVYDVYESLLFRYANVGVLVMKSPEVRKDADVPMLLQLQAGFYACTQVVLAEEMLRESWRHMTSIKVLLLLEMGCQTDIWNPGGCSDFSATTWPTSFQQWDPGVGFYSPYSYSAWKGIKWRLLQVTLGATTYIQPGFSTSILEDKDVLKGGVMIGTQLLGIGPILLESMEVRGRGAMHQINSHERCNHLLRWHELCR